MDLRKIEVNRGEVVGIGKIKIPQTQDFQYTIQMFTFLVIKEEGVENSYISTCIHLHIDGYGENIAEAKKDMAENIYYFLCQNFEKLSPEDAWDNLRALLKVSDWSNELWNAYNEAQLQLSIQGKPTDDAQKLFKRLEQLEKRVRKLESKVTQVRFAEEIIKLTEDLIVEYTPVAEVA